MEDRKRSAQFTAQIRRAGQVATLGGGYERLIKGGFEGCTNLITPWHGVPRVVSAALVQSGLTHWRHATANELVEWVLAGFPGWNKERSLVVAVGTIIGDGGVPLVRTDPRHPSAKPQLTTMSFEGMPSIRTKLQAVLHADPKAFALCVVPRG